MKKAQVLSVAYTVALWVPLPASLASLLLSLAQGLCMYYFLCLQCSVLSWVITFPRKTSLTFGVGLPSPLPRIISGHPSPF